MSENPKPTPNLPALARPRTVARSGGRPPFTPTADQIKQVETMIASKLPRQLMARIIGIDKKTFTRAFTAQLRTAVARANMAVVSNLHNLTKKSTRACEFWLVNMDGEHWRPLNQSQGPTIIDNSQRQIVYSISEADRKF